jgi:hypothetical protein
MKTTLLCLLFASFATFIGCIETENAADVNQDRIKTEYYTTFNASKNKTNSMIIFKFGSTTLKVSNPPYYNTSQLKRDKNILQGTYYWREVSGTTGGSYEWTDENGKVYVNAVVPYAFQLTTPPTQLKKNTYYQLDWTGQAIPNQTGSFTIKIANSGGSPSVTFTSGQLIEIEADDLISLNAGSARMEITREYNDPVDEKTQAGGTSKICFVREYNVTILDE